MLRIYRAMIPLELCLLFPEKKVKTQIRCDRLIAAHCGCFGKQDRPCLSDENCSGGRQTGPGDSEGERARRGQEAGETEGGAK